MAPTSTSPHPLVAPIRGLFLDFLSTLAFLVVFSLTGRLAIAVGAGIVTGAAQIGRLLWLKRPTDLMQWFSLALLVTFGGASILTHNYAFYRFKFTLIYGAIGLVMLRPGWMLRYMPPVTLARGADVARTFGYIWAGLFLGTAALNALLVVVTRPSVWAWFIAVFPLATKAVLVIAQYGLTRFIIRRRMRVLTPPPALPG